MRVSELLEGTVGQLLDKLNRRQVSAVELTRASLDRIEQRDERVKAFLSLDAETALAKAEEIDRRRTARKPLGKLVGIPLSLIHI